MSNEESQAPQSEGTAKDAPKSTATGSFPPVNTTDPQLTIRAIMTGMLLGGLLSLCNIYAGLKIGWGFNMSITAMLLSFGFFKAFEKAGGRPYGMLENNINQTAASAGANISSAGLVAPIPALTILTGMELSWHLLALWTFAVSCVGIVVGLGLRKQMIEVDRLPFPSGVASAETIQQMYARGEEAIARVKALVAGMILGGGAKLLIKFAEIKKLKLPGTIAASGAAQASGATSFSLAKLTFAVDPSPLFWAVGAIVGIRAGASMLIGAIVAWIFLAPHAMNEGWVVLENADSVNFPTIVKWMLWPGVAMMVTASLTSFAFSWRSVLAALTGIGGQRDMEEKGVDAPDNNVGDIPRKVFIAAVVAALIFATLTQVLLFEISLWVAMIAVLLTFALAIVAGRVSGETGITPVGAMGKVTQLTFGLISPGSVTSNLMAANVTGGAASQTADLLHDLKTGAMIGASPKAQGIGQLFGVMAGATIGCAAYLVMIPNPAEQLMTEEWAAPAVVQWKAVAELFRDGIDHMPPMAVEAMMIAGAVGVLFSVLEKMLPKEKVQWLPSASAMGIAFCIPASYAITMFLGGVVSVLVGKFAPTWKERFLIVVASGLIAGESLVGAGIAIYETASGLVGG